MTVARPSRGLVGPGRLELPTLRLSGVRSNHLSYGPMAVRQARSFPGSRSHASSRPTECRNALKRETGKRNEDGGEPHFIGASIEPPRERRSGEASLERR